jgi:outer membrane protein assembly factor BamB
MTLEDHLRGVTRNFTRPLPEDDVLTLGAELARELARAHAESPPRHPDLEPAVVTIHDGKPRLESGASRGSEAEDLFTLGALLAWLATGVPPEVSWRLDGVPAAPLSTLARRAALLGLGGPRRAERFASAAEAGAALDTARRGSADATAPWPVFRGDAGRSGAGPVTPAAGAFDAVWHARLGAVVASPIVAPGAVLVPTADGRLAFVDPLAGRVLHELPLGAAVESTPALAGGLAYVGTDDGELVAVDATAGEERWRVRLGQMVRSSALALEPQERVLVGVVEGKSGGVAAVDVVKGKVAWMRKLGAVFSSPAVAGDRILVGSDDGSLHAIDVGRGTVAWSYRLGAKVRATPAVAGDLAIVGDFSGLLAAVHTAKGTHAWSRAVGHAFYSSACVAGDLCVVGCREGHVHGFDLATGEPRFETATRGPVVSSPVATGAGFLVGSTDGGLYLIGADGRVLHRSELSTRGVQSSAALGVEPVAFVGSGDGLHAVRLRP